MKFVLAIVGNAGGTNVGESLRRAAVAAGFSVRFVDSCDASSGSRIVNALRWRFADRRPARLVEHSREIVTQCTRDPRCDVLIATGSAPLTAGALASLRHSGITSINYSTDDPWNPSSRASWHLDALPAYDIVFTPRRANIADMRNLGCADVRYLPFGYDSHLFGGPGTEGAGVSYDVLFVGGADPDRASFLRKFSQTGPTVTIAGAYWKRYSIRNSENIGYKSPSAVLDLTASARINLCLVRRANRDGHVMRSLEIAAIGGCMLAEDTEEHRDLFGDDREAVLYFRSPEEAARRANSLLADPETRCRLARALRSRIQLGKHTYHDRLMSMLDSAASPARMTVTK